MKECIHFISDFNWYSQRRYKTDLKKALKAHMDYVTRKEDGIICFNFDKKLWMERVEYELKKRWDSRVALSFIMALPQDVNKDNIQKWKKIILLFLKKILKVPENHISLAFHLHKGISGEYNPHVHIFIYPRMENGKKLDTKKPFLSFFHRKWDEILNFLGYKVKKENDKKIKITTKDLYSNKEFLKLYKEYIYLKKFCEGIKMEEKEFEENTIKYTKDELKQLFKEVKFFDPIFWIKKENILYTKTRSGYLISSPFREDKNPSFHIFYDEKKGWKYYDFATKESGSLIDLYVRYYGFNPVQALKQIVMDYKDYGPDFGEVHSALEREEEKGKKLLETSSAPAQNKNFSSSSLLSSQAKVPSKPKEQKKDYKILKVLKPSSKALTSYLSQRGIKVIPTWLYEVVYSKKGKKFFALAIKDINGNYHLRDKLYKRVLKGSDEKSTFSYINNNSNYVIICEGLFDALSFYQVYGDKVDYIILNSVSHLKDVILFLKSKEKDLSQSYEAIVLALDNDEAGLKAEKEFLTLYKPLASIILKAEYLGSDPNEALLNGSLWQHNLKILFDPFKQNSSSISLNSQKRISSFKSFKPNI